MSKAFTKHIAFFLFVAMMTNLGVWGFSGAKLKHEIAHNIMELAPSAHQHAFLRPAGDSAITERDNKLRAFEHQVLHAVDHLKLFPDTALNDAFAPSADGMLQTHFVVQSLPLSTYDPPFRPPSGGALPA
ncbi:MAG: hypothetical protein H7Z39_03500 [Burkholderiaceae bacterium]|nr:hypothetical protein [Burkholderiaceae bacterium]